MIIGELKNKVDKLWEMFWTGGLTNPLDVIEQITQGGTNMFWRVDYMKRQGNPASIRV